MDVLIVSKTRMSNAACVGGLVLAQNRNVRLLNQGGRNQPENTEFKVGEIWDIDFVPRHVLTAPHLEDVLVTGKKFVREQKSISRLLYARRLVDWQGNINEVFDGLLHWTGPGSGYINPNDADRSVGFWISDRDLTHFTSFDRVRYRYNANHHLPYVGYHPAIETIPAGTIIRVSLGRPFTSNGVRGCWLQLSGWY